MKTETLNILGPVSAEAAERAGATLKAIPGVHDVSFLDGPARVYAHIDDKTTTRAQLAAAPAGAGVLVEEKQSPHAIPACERKLLRRLRQLGSWRCRPQGGPSRMS